MRSSIKTDKEREKSSDGSISAKYADSKELNSSNSVFFNMINGLFEIAYGIILFIPVLFIFVSFISIINLMGFTLQGFLLFLILFILLSK